MTADVSLEEKNSRRETYQGILSKWNVCCATSNFQLALLVRQVSWLIRCCRYVNPLFGQTESMLMREAEELYKGFEFEKYIDSSELSLDMWKRGILLAADPDTWLTEVEMYDTGAQVSHDKESETTDRRGTMNTTDQMPSNAMTSTAIDKIETAYSSAPVSRTTGNLTLSTSNPNRLPQRMHRSAIENVALENEADTGWANLRHLTPEAKFVLVTCAFGALAQ